MPQWRDKWDVPSSSSDRVYTVSRDVSETEWGCSCPAWKFQRKICHHIKQIMDRLGLLRT
jgi:hypothetical protein